MRLATKYIIAGILLFSFCATAMADAAKILTNHLGYESTGPKHAVILGNAGQIFSTCALKQEKDGQTVFTAPAKTAGQVKKWRDWQFWTVDFDAYSVEGKYYLECSSGTGLLRSYPFAIQHFLLERNTLSDVIYYFKEERSTGLFDKADRHLPFEGKTGPTLDAHGGWWDATGDYGKHLSHLSFSTYFNPQQIPFVVYSLFKSYEQLNARNVPEFNRYKERLLDEAMYGADYLVRVKAPSGSFYRSVATGSDKQVPEERKVARDARNYVLYQPGDKGRPGVIAETNDDLAYEVSYRSGGGVAIAALAIASTFPFSGEFRTANYLKAAEDAFDYLEMNNLRMLNDGKENIVDDYCALTAATELYKATKKEKYLAAADRRARNLMARLVTSGGYSNYWRADDGDRPFFHAVDAGFPALSLLYYAEIANPETQRQVFDTVKKSLAFQLGVSQEVVNPFAYARQLVQTKTGKRRTSFFFPHDSDAAPWWQGENARLASISAATRLAEPHFTDDPEFERKLRAFSASQLNWILGLNPFDSSMLCGVGRNNPEHMFLDSWEFTNIPGGISNGITGSFDGNEDGIDYDLKYHQTGGDNDWRWQEQWLPHDAWYLLAVSVKEDDPSVKTNP